MKIPVALALSLALAASAFTNTKVAHIKDSKKEHRNPDLVGYTSTAETPDFHFRRLGTTSAATEFAQVSVKLDLNNCLLYTSPSPRDKRQSRMPSSA